MLPNLSLPIQRRLALLAAIAAGLAAPAPATAFLTDSGGATVTATDWSTPRAQVPGAAGCEPGAPAGACRLLASPGTPSDDPAAALASLASPASPEDDLHAALTALATATSAERAVALRDELLAVLEGDPVAGRAYSGIPLLNWNPSLKVRRVPAGGEVVVTVVRTPGHSLSDTWLLDFEDPDQAFTIRYRVAELGGALGGSLAPAPLLEDGATALGGLHSSLLPLTPGAMDTGTRDASRFTARRGLPADGAPEQTRSAIQEIPVRMPPARMARAILDPSGTRTPSVTALRPATAERIARAARALGLEGTEPTPAERRAAIERLAPAAPERQLWSDLMALPAAGEEGFLAAARTLGEQDLALVAAMARRDALPAGVPADPSSDLTLVLQNNETYVSAPKVRPATGRTLRVRVVNRDAFAHSFEALGLGGRRPVLGALDWGRFDWSPLREAVAGELAGGETATWELDLPGGTFAVALGDPDAGDQATTVVGVESGPRTESLRLGRDPSAGPLHAAFAPDGALWVTMSGADSLVRVDAAGALSAAETTEVLMPGGAHSPTSALPPLEPADVAVDARGIVWASLVAGNAIARIDPAAVRDGTTDGARIYKLPACGHDECAVPFPPPPGAEPETRQPLQIEVTLDASGDAAIWHTQAGARRIGVLRVAPDGTERGQTMFSCGCTSPLGLALDEAGDVWFTEAVDNRVGRLTPGTTRPYAAAEARLRHYPIPSSVRTVEPDVARGELVTSLPHSLFVDDRGLVWLTESATGKIAVLDPAAARPGTSEGFTEVDLPANDFKGAAVPADLTVDPAGRVFWTDEYGDAVGTVDGDPGALRTGPTVRPVSRRSLTDSPVISPVGELLFIESAANLLVRVSGVGTGRPLPVPVPAVRFDTAQEALSLSGMHGVGSVDVEVRRAGAVVARASGVSLTAGGARIAGGDWTGGADALAPGDRVTISRHGRHARAALVHALPEFTARAQGGRVAGRVTVAGEPVAGHVVFPGGERAPVAAADGAFSGPAVSDAPSTASWSTATPGARYETVVAVTAPQEPPTPAPATPPATAPATPVPAPVDPAPVKPAPAQPGADVCAQRLWLAGDARRPRPAWLGSTSLELRRCLGQPSRVTTGARGFQRWTYPGLRVDVDRGRVTRALITAGAWRSESGGLRVGASSRAISGALPATRASGRAVVRAVVGLDGRWAADIAIRLGDSGRRVTRIDVRRQRVGALDRAGRQLLRRAP